MKWIWILIAAFAMTAAAADVTGTWKATFEGPNGKGEGTFVLKSDGDKVTGTYASRFGEAPISEGKLEGENISFFVVRNLNGNEFKLSYKGTVQGNDMKLTVSFPGGDQTFEIIAKKVS